MGVEREMKSLERERQREQKEVSLHFTGPQTMKHSLPLVTDWSQISFTFLIIEASLRCTDSDKTFKEYGKCHYSHSVWDEDVQIDSSLVQRTLGLKCLHQGPLTLHM